MATATTHPVDPELDEVLNLVESRRRRSVLYRLDDADTDVVTFDDLVSAVLARDPNSTDRGVVALDLHHNHLPKLDDTGWIEYDPRSETIRYRHRAVHRNLLTVLRDVEFH